MENEKMKYDILFLSELIIRGIYSENDVCRGVLPGNDKLEKE